MNAVEIEEAVSKLVEEPFNAAEFPYAFLEAFGNKTATRSSLSVSRVLYPINECSIRLPTTNST